MAQPKGFPKKRNIIRIETPAKEGHGRTYGWQVRFGLKGKEFSKLFSDSKYGSIEKAFEEAINFRDSFVVDYTEIKNNKSPSCHPLDLEKVKGVSFIKGRALKTKPNEFSSYWKAQWTDGPNRHKGFKNFFVATHGNENAYNLAVKARREAMGETEDCINIKSIFKTPNDSNIKIWRYLDFTKFISILEMKSLFFVFAENLNDPFEGSLSALNKKLQPTLFEKKFFQNNINRSEMRTRVAVNCWHINTHESAAMWKLYAKTNEAVCVQSTYGCLRDALPKLFRLSEVRYVDYQTDWIPESHPLMPFIFKRKSFEHEHELRAMIDIQNIDEHLFKFMGMQPSEEGLYKNISINNLIKSIYVAPDSSDWFFELVKKSCKTYGLNEVSVIRSSLETEPFF